MDNNNNLYHFLLLCVCNKELFHLKNINNSEEGIQLVYHCSKNKFDQVSKISLSSYLLHIKEEKNLSPGICYYSHHEYKQGVIYCYVCSQWLCENCLKSHDQIYLNHLYSFYEINISNFCLSHPNNIASFSCKDCNGLFCKSCSKKHKKHFTISFDTFKKKQLENLEFMKFTSFESHYKKVTTENEKIYKQNADHTKGNKFEEDQYLNYYQGILNLNKAIFSLYEAVFWNYSTLCNRSWDICDILVVINQIKIKSLINLKDSNKQQISKCLPLIFPTKPLKFNKKKFHKPYIFKRFQIENEQFFEKAYTLSQNKLVLITSCDFCFYDCQTEIIEPSNFLPKIIETSGRDELKVPSFYHLEKSNLFLMNIQYENYKGSYFWDYTTPGYDLIDYNSIFRLPFYDCVELDKDIILVFWHSFRDDPRRIYFTLILKYRLIRDHSPNLKKEINKMFSSPQRIQVQLLSELETVDGIISIIQYVNDIFYLVRSPWEGPNLDNALYSIDFSHPNQVLKLEKNFDKKNIKSAKKLNATHFGILFNYEFQIFEFKSLKSIYKGELIYYDTFFNDTFFFGVTIRDNHYIGLGFDVNDDCSSGPSIYYPFDDDCFMFQKLKNNQLIYLGYEKVLIIDFN